MASGLRCYGNLEGRFSAWWRNPPKNIPFWCVLGIRKKRVRNLRKSLKLFKSEISKNENMKKLQKQLSKTKGGTWKRWFPRLESLVLVVGVHRQVPFFWGLCMSQFSKVAAQLISLGSQSLFSWLKPPPRPEEQDTQIPTFYYYIEVYSDIHYNIG